jgi:hypothetical protein
MCKCVGAKGQLLPVTHIPRELKAAEAYLERRAAKGCQAFQTAFPELRVDCLEVRIIESGEGKNGSGGAEHA